MGQSSEFCRHDPLCCFSTSCLLPTQHGNFRIHPRKGCVCVCARSISRCCIPSSCFRVCLALSCFIFFLLCFAYFNDFFTQSSLLCPCNHLVSCVTRCMPVLLPTCRVSVRGSAVPRYSALTLPVLAFPRVPLQRIVPSVFGVQKCSYSDRL
jgi:hypothetical protein